MLRVTMLQLPFSQVSAAQIVLKLWFWSSCHRAVAIISYLFLPVISKQRIESVPTHSDGRTIDARDIAS